MPPKKKTPRPKPSKKRQTTLSWPLSSPILRRSARTANPPVPVDVPAAAPTSTLLNKPSASFEVIIITPRKRQSSPPVPVAVDDTNDEEEDEGPVRGSARRRRISREAAAVDDTSDDDEDEGPVTSSARRRRPRPPVIVDNDEETQKPKGKAWTEDEGVTLQVTRKRAGSDDDDDESVITPASKRRRNSTHTSSLKGKSRQRPVHDEEGDGDHKEDGSDDDSLEVLPPHSRSNKNSGDDGSDIGSDLELAQQTPTVKSRTRYAGSSSKKKTAYQQGLALMLAQRERRRNGGLPSSQPVPNVSSDNDAGEDESEGDYNEDSEDESRDLLFGLDGDLNADLEDFVVEDTADDLIGAPDVEMPIQFTSASHESNAQQFRVYAQYLIFSVLFPGKFAKDARVVNAINRLESVAGGFNESVVQSAAWKPEFLRALKARPGFRREECDPEEHCDACNRNNQRATNKVQFLGRRYNRDTLDDLSSDEDEETQDSNGEQLFSADTVFTLGSWCFVRAECAHTLLHWKKELKGWVVAALQRRRYIDEDGNIREQAAESMSDEKKEEWANRICDEMRANIDELYDDFKRTIKDARERMSARRGTGRTFV